MEADKASIRAVLRSRCVQLAFRILLRQKWYLLAMVFIIPLETVSLLAFPYFLNTFIQRGMNGEKITGLHIASLIVVPVVSTILSGLIFNLKDQMQSHFGLEIEGVLRKKILNISPIDLSSVYTKPEIMRVMTDSHRITKLLTNDAPELARGVVMTIASLIAMYTVSPSITLVVLLTVPLLFLSRKSLKKVREINRELYRKEDHLNGSTLDSILFAHALKLNGAEKRENETYQRLRKEYLKDLRKNFFVELFGVNVLTSFVEGLSVALIYLVGITWTQVLPFSRALQMALYAERFQGEIGARYVSVLEAFPTITRFDALLNLRETEVDPDPVELKNVGSIELVGVTASYPGQSEPALKNVSLRIERGERAAFVGRTGSGKSTIINLLVRFLEPTEGEILINGLPIKRYSLESLRKAIGVCSQEPSILERTVSENIRLGNPQATPGEVEKAARAAAIHEDILRMPQQYETLIKGLSGGQAQRIGFARTMLRDKQVLILDEHTSQVDSKTAATMGKSISPNTTTIVIAHRYSAIREVDKVFVFHTGELVEQGPFHVLRRKRGGVFRELWVEQTGNQITRIFHKLWG